MWKWVRRIVVVLVAAFVIALLRRLGGLQDARIAAGQRQGEPDAGGSVEGQQAGVRLPGNERCSLLCFDLFAGWRKSLLAIAAQSQSEYEDLDRR